MTTESKPLSTPDSASAPKAEQLAQLEAAKKELAKLPLLGPVTWLFARDAQRRFTFFADLDWRLLPPLVLDQCRLFSKEDLPWAFVTWARVSDAVDQRLRSSSPVIAPHEWHSGPHLWLIDVVAPFGEAEEIAKLALSDLAPGGSARVWLLDAAGQPRLKEVRGNG
jgi:cytolysin-activating lysine-acyltransferase